MSTEDDQRTEMEKAFIANQDRRNRERTDPGIAQYHSAGPDQASNTGPVPEFEGPKPKEEPVKKKRSIFGL